MLKYPAFCLVSRRLLIPSHIKKLLYSGDELQSLRKLCIWILNEEVVFIVCLRDCAQSFPGGKCAAVLWFKMCMKSNLWNCLPNMARDEHKLREGCAGTWWGNDDGSKLGNDMTPSLIYKWLWKQERKQVVLVAICIFVQRWQLTAKTVRSNMPFCPLMLGDSLQP